MDSEPDRPAGPSRRTVLAGAAAVFALGSTLFATSAARADGMPTLGQVIATAMPTRGQTLTQTKQTLGTTGIWGAFEGEWCAWFPTWLLRGNGIPFDSGDFTVSRLWDHFPAERHGSVPRPGALIFYSGHVGLVTDVVGGYPKSIEGNTGYYRGATNWSNSTVNTFTGGSARILGYAYPQYDGYDAMTGAGAVGPLTEGNFLMALTDAEQAELLAGVRVLLQFVCAGGPAVASGIPGKDFDPNSLMGRVTELEKAVFYGGAEMSDDDKSISESLAEIHTELRQLKG